jgi:hypothetical protein
MASTSTEINPGRRTPNPAVVMQCQSMAAQKFARLRSFLVQLSSLLEASNARIVDRQRLRARPAAERILGQMRARQIG